MSTELFNKLTVNNIDEFSKNLAEFDFTDYSVNDQELMLILRPFMWYVDGVAFQDLYDVSLGLFKVLDSCVKRDLISMDNRDFKEVMRFVLEFTQNGNYYRGFFSIQFSFDTVKSEIENSLSSEELSTIESFANKFKKLSDINYQLYDHLRGGGIEERHFDKLFDLIKTFPSEYLDWVLHALAVFENNPRVIEFFKEMKEQNEDLVDEIDRYLEMVEV